VCGFSAQEGERQPDPAELLAQIPDGALELLGLEVEPRDPGAHGLAG
jgi:hypothetical protein